MTSQVMPGWCRIAGTGRGGPTHRLPCRAWGIGSSSNGQARDIRGRVRANGADFAPLRVRPIYAVLYRLCLAVARTALPTGEAIAARDAEHGTPAWGAFSSLVLHRGF